MDNKDFITYARYKVIRDKVGRITDMVFVFANERMKELIHIDPIGQKRSAIMPVNDKMCRYAQNVLDIGIAKHFSYTDASFGYIEGIIEPDIYDPSNINIYTVDVALLKQNNNEQFLKNRMSTIMSMFNVTLLHWNAKEHYIYSDNILTTDFKEDNPDLYVGNNIRSSYELYKIADDYQRKKIEEEVEKLINGNLSFLNFTVTIINSINELVPIHVIVIPEEVQYMYMIGIQY